MGRVVSIGSIVVMPEIGYLVRGISPEAKAELSNDRAAEAAEVIYLGLRLARRYAKGEHAEAWALPAF